MNCFVIENNGNYHFGEVIDKLDLSVFGTKGCLHRAAQALNPKKEGAMRRIRKIWEVGTAETSKEVSNE